MAVVQNRIGAIFAMLFLLLALAAFRTAYLGVFRGSALRFMLTRLVDWLNVPPGALVKPKDPLEYLAKLKFHQTIGDASAYGIEG